MRLRLGVALASALALAAPGRLLAGAFSGRVVAPDGGPVAGAVVSWYAARTPNEARADATAGTSPKPLGQTRTDAGGRFEASVDPAGPFVRFRVEPAGLPGAALDGPYDPAETTRLPDVALPAAALLSGLVSGSDGKPIAGARVIARDAAGADRDDVEFFAEATTGADGAFRLPNAPASARRLSVRAAGWMPATRTWRDAPDALRVTLEHGGVVTGTVADVGGHAIPGALVRAGDVAAVSDAQGTYRLEGVSAGLQSVEAGTAKNLVARRGGVRVAAGTPASADLVLQPGGSIAGTVVDAVTRRPISGARLAVGPPHVAFAPPLDPSAYARADARGRFTATGLLPGDYEVRAEKTGYLPAALPRVAVKSAGAAPAPLALTPAASITGRVVDAQGKPVPGAAVTLEASRGGRGRLAAFAAGPRGARPGTTARTGPDGSFRLDGLAAITSGVPLVATHAGYAPAERPGVTLKAGQALANVVLVLPAGLSVKGRVVDGTAQPVSGAEIRVAPSQGQGRGGGRFFRPPGGAPSAPNAVTAADGTFTVAGLAPGAYDVTASHDGFSPKTSPALPAPTKLPTGWPPIVLARGAAVAGVVHDDQGAPIAGASVSALGEGLEPRQTNTDGNGTFRLDDLVKGRPLMLAANAPGYGFASRSVTAPAEGITVVLGKSGTIRGRVVDATTGAPVTAFSVGASPAARGRRGPGAFGGAPSQAQYSEDGTFEVTVAPGSWNVRAAADGYRPADVSNLDVDAGQTKEGVEIALKRGGGLTGHVTDLRGNPVSGASIACCDAASARPGAAFGGDGSGPTATSDGDGHFALDGLPDGHATLTVTHPDYVTTSRDVDPASTGDVVIQVSSGAEISGTVVSSDAGQAVPGASVRLDPEGDSGTAVGASQTAQADGGGGFRFDHLTAGRYRLTAQTKTASSTPQDLVVADSQPMDGVRVAVSTGVEVDGTVTGLPAGQLGGVNISATATGFNGSAVTADDGTFTLTSVPEGVLRVTASTSMPSVRTVAQTIETSADQSPMSVQLAFQGVSRLSGQVTRGGQAVTQFSITAAPDPPDGTGRRYTAMSDGSGHYDIENMTDGNYDVTVIGTDNPYRTTIAVSGDTNGDIVMPAATISGVVTDSASGAPLDGATVQAQTGVEATSQAIKRATTDSTGAYSLSGLDPGDYQVSARKDGYQLKTQPLTLGGDPATLDLALDPGAGLSILAGDGLTGMPLGGIVAIAFGAGGTIAFQGSVALDATGAGQVPSLPPGQYAVYFFSSGYAGRAMPSVTVPSAPVRVTLTPGGSVQARASAATAGRIVDATGNPVLLAPNRLDGSVTVAPPVSVWQHIAPGSYSFVAPSGTSTTAYPFTVVEGQVTTLALP